LQRLLWQCELLEPEARWLLAQIGVGPAWRTADIGCGPLGILNLLAEAAGPGGEVLGLERDPKMLALGKQELSAHALKSVKLVEGDARRTGLPQSHFDLAHARLLLVNLPEPAQVVAEMASIVSPGGWVALEEVDWISWTCDPPHPAWTRLIDLNAEVWRSKGLDVYMGRRLPRLLREAGMVDIQHKVHAPVWRMPAHLNQNLLLAFSEISRPTMIALGLTTEAEWSELTAAVRAHLADAGTVVFDALFCQAWGRKPVVLRAPMS
jgi:SAM-dependent methyltransferase